jgi:hypothetical protein
MDAETLLMNMGMSRERLLGILEKIEKSGQDPAKVLAWRPGPARAHIGWQAMHCAATHEGYFAKSILEQSPRDAELMANFGGGSTPSDTNVPSLAAIRGKLSATYEPLRKFVAAQTPQSLAQQKPGPGGKVRSVGEIITLLNWHEAHHQGQIHLTWNLYRAAHGVA